MNFLLYLLLIIFGIMALLKKPYFLLGIYFFLNFYNFNIHTSFFLDIRGVLGVLLLLRFILDDRGKKAINNIFNSNRIAFIILVYYSLVYILSYFIKPDFHYLKILIKIITNITIIHILAVQGKQDVIYRAIFISGILFTFDMLFSYFTLERLYVKKIIDAILNRNIFYNHNTVGFICGFATILGLIFFYRNKKSSLARFSMFISTLGLLLSTSRSALLGFFIFIIFFIRKEKNIRFGNSNVIKIGIPVFFVVLLLFGFNEYILSNNLISNRFLERVKFRLFEEPVQLIQNGGEATTSDFRTTSSIIGRIERYNILMYNFYNLSLNEKLLGVGKDGIIRRNLTGDHLNPHNGFIMVLVEDGIIGFLFFLFIWIIIFKKTYSNISYNYNYSLYPLLYLLGYAIGQNASLTGQFFLIFAVLAGFSKERN